MTTIKIIARNSGELVRVIRSKEEEAMFALLPPLENVQPTIEIDLTENRNLVELVDGNNWAAYSVVAGTLKKNGTNVFIHPDSQAEADWKQLPAFFVDLEGATLPALPNVLENYLANSTPTGAETVAALKALIQWHELHRNGFFDRLIKVFRLVRYVLRHVLKVA